MKVECMHISDTHEQNVYDIVVKSLEENKRAKEGVDVLFISGDLTYRGLVKKLKRLRQQLDGLIEEGYVSEVVVIPGNHDLTFQRFHGRYNNPAEAKRCFTGNPRIHLLIHEAKEIQGIKVFGSPWTPEFHNWAYNYYSSDAYGVWKEIPEDTEVLMTHGPPLWILDEVARNMKIDYCGCPTLRRIIEEKFTQLPLRYHLFGHIHEGYGRLEKWGIEFLNSSIMDGSYKPNNKPQYFTFTK